MCKIKLKEHKWPGGEFTIEGRNEIFTLACLMSMARDFPKSPPTLRLGRNPVTQAAENNKEWEQTPVTIDRVVVPIILLNTFCGWWSQGGVRRAARNKGRDVNYRLQTISPDILVQVSEEKYGILKVVWTVWF